LVEVIKDVVPQRYGRTYYECHMGLTPMVVPLLSREEATVILQERDNIEQSQVRSAADVKRFKGLAPPFPTTADELIGWLANWQLALYMLYGPLCVKYIRARALTQDVQGDMAHCRDALTSKLCHYIIRSVFTSAPDLFRKIWSPARQQDLPMSSLAALLGLIRQGQLGEPIGFPSHLIQQYQLMAPTSPAYRQAHVMMLAQDLGQYRDSPLIIRQYDPRVVSVMERIQKLHNGIGVK
jgi:hypothetical protein